MTKNILLSSRENQKRFRRHTNLKSINKRNIIENQQRLQLHMQSKTKANKNTKKKPIVQTKESYQIEQDGAQNTSSLENLKEHQNEKISPTANLTVVREASASSEEAESRKQAYRSKNKKIKQQQIASKFEERGIQEEYLKQDETIYDQYNVLKISGLLDAYQHFLKLLCKHGLPTGKVYEYAAQEIQKYERRKINKQLKMKAELDIQKISKRAQQMSPSPQRNKNISPYYS